MCSNTPADLEEIDLVIVGAGPAGLFATFCAGLRDIGSITLEAMDAPGGQLYKLYPEKYVYDVQGIPKIRAMELVTHMTQQARMFGSEIRTNSSVTDIIPRNDQRYDVEVNGKTAYTARTILLATGIGSFTPVRIGVPGEEEYTEKGVTYRVGDPEYFRGKRVLIVGAGDSAFDWTEEISSVARNVIIAQRGTRIRAAERMVKNVMERDNVDIMLNTMVTRITGNGSWIEEALVTNTETGEDARIPVDHLLVAIGHKSDPVIFKTLKPDMTGRFIRIDRSFETSLKGIYAVGDAANLDSDQKVLLIAVGGAEAYMAINNIKRYLEPKASLFGGHSSSLKH